MTIQRTHESNCCMSNKIAFVHRDAFIEKMELGTEGQKRPQYSKAGSDLATRIPCVNTDGP